MRKINLFFSVVVMVFLLAVWGCGDGDVGSVTGCGGDVLCVGMLTLDPSLTIIAEGLAETAGKAEADIDSAGGNIELHVKEVGACADYSADRAAAKELIDMGVNAIVGHICSGGSNSILGGGDEDPVSGIQNVIMISPSNTAPVFSKADPIYDYYFRTVPSDVNQAAVLAEEIKVSPHLQTYMIYRDDTWGKLLKDALLGNGISASDMIMEYRKEKLGTVVASDVEEFLEDKGEINIVLLAFDEAEDILKKLLNSEKISNKNRYYLADGYYSSLEKLEDKLEKLGKDDLAENPETLAELFHTNSSGFLATAPDDYEYEDMELVRAQKELQSQYENQPYVLSTYDAVVLLALAYLSSGSTEPGVLAEELLTVSGPPGKKCTSYEKCAMQIKNGDTDINYEGLSGPIDFDQKGDIKGAIYKILSYFDRTIKTERGIKAH